MSVVPGAVAATAAVPHSYCTGYSGGVALTQVCAPAYDQLPLAGVAVGLVHGISVGIAIGVRHPALPFQQALITKHVCASGEASSIYRTLVWQNLEDCLW